MKLSAKYICLFCFILFFNSSCKFHKENVRTKANISTSESIFLKYAKNINIQKNKDYVLVNIKDPWNKGHLLHSYILIQDGQKVPKNINGTIIHTPIDNIIVYSSVHLSMINDLGEISKVKGACETKYITSDKIIQLIRQGKISDVGKSTSPNLETIIDLKGKVIIASPFQNSDYGSIKKLNIPIIESADYMENNPLGRCEWIKFFGLLLNREKEADSLFNSVESNYLYLKQLVEKEEYIPTVISEKKYGGTWFVPAGESYMSNFFKDAGANYLYKNTKGTGSKALTFESVLEKCINSDFWLIKYYAENNMTYNSLKEEYTPYSNFKAFKNKTIYGCNTIRNSYYDDITIHPDYILKDLISIFHPNLLPKYNRRYFKKITD